VTGLGVQLNVLLGRNSKKSPPIQLTAPLHDSLKKGFSHCLDTNWALALVKADTMCQAGLQPAIQDRTLGRSIRHLAIKSSNLCSDTVKEADNCDKTFNTSTCWDTERSQRHYRHAFMHRTHPQIAVKGTCVSPSLPEIHLHSKSDSTDWKITGRILWHVQIRKEFGTGSSISYASL